MYSMLNSQGQDSHHKSSRLIPLLLAFAVTQAFAGETYYNGNAGAAGVNGINPGAAGTAGEAGELLDLLVPLPRPEYHTSINGGRGGNGGNGATGGDAGAGGMGGSVTARVTGRPAADNHYYLAGGTGGNAGIPGTGGKGAAGGAGGAATHVLDLTLTRTFPQSSAWTDVTGGAGGSGAVAGVGGAATIDSTVKAEDASAFINVEATGGTGGSAVGAGNGAAGGAASTRSSVAASSWEGHIDAIGGNGGNGIGTGHRGGAGGSASVGVNTTGDLAGNAWVGARGGNGGHGLMGAAGGDGRDVVLQTPLVLSNDNNASRDIRLYGVGGIGGDSEGSSAGKGGTADVSLSLQDQRSGASLYAVTAVSGGGGSASGARGIAASGAASTARGDVSGSGNIKVEAESKAGSGGRGTNVWGAAGGIANASAISRSDGKASAAAKATGGSGGSATGKGTRGGDGGAAYASAASQGNRSGASATVDATGGSGGNGTAFGGNGGAVNLVNAVVGTTTGTLVLSQRAEGGAGGDGVTPGVGGNATSHLTLIDDKAGTINATVQAFGGLGGLRPVAADPVGRGGTSDARLDITARALGSTVSGKVRAAAITGPRGETYYTTGDATARSVVQADRNASSVAEAATGLMSLQPLEPGVLALRANAYAKAASNGASTASASALSNELWGVSEAHAEASGGNQATLATALGEGHVAHVTAYASARDGASSTADASANSGQGSVRAESVSTGSNGARVATSASAPVLSGFAHVRSSANIGGVIERLPSKPDRNISTATAAPGQAALAAFLADAPIVAAAFAQTSVVGAGTMLGFLGPEEVTGYSGITTANFQFDTVSPGYLKLGLLNGTGYIGWGADAPVGQLELTISNHGMEVFSRSFTSLSAAASFFNDDAYFLGELAAGSQDLLITAGFTMRNRGGFGFEYVLGVSPVPEPRMWMLILLGTTVILLRRRRSSR